MVRTRSNCLPWVLSYPAKTMDCGDRTASWGRPARLLFLKPIKEFNFTVRFGLRRLLLRSHLCPVG